MNAPANISPDIGLAEPPFDIETEQALLGACLIDQKRLAVAGTSCTGEDFYDPLHRRIWDAMQEMDAAHRPITPLTMQMRMADDPGLKELRGISYLAGMVQAVPTLVAASETRVVTEWARGIADLAARRQSMEGLLEAYELLGRRDTSVVEVLKPVVAAADRIVERVETSTGSRHAGDAAQALMSELENRDSKGPAGVTTGLAKLDDLLGSLYPENLIIVAGRPGMGKSSVGTNLARAAAEAGHPVEYFSLEMSRRELCARIVCDLDFSKRENASVAPVHYSRLLKRRISDKEFDRAIHAARDLKGLPIFIHDRDGMTMAEIAALARARAAQAEGRIGLVVVDHLQIIKSSDRYRGHRVSELTEMTGQAKALAKAIKWPVVLLSQLSRDIERRPEKDRMPLLSDLRESGSIEQDADAVIGVLRPAHYVRERKPALGSEDPDFAKWLVEYEAVKGRMDFGVRKNRHGEINTVECFVDIAASAIRNSDPFNGASIDPEFL